VVDQRSGRTWTYSIVIDTQGVPEDVTSEVEDFLNGLQDYPIVDEDLHAKMEMEARRRLGRTGSRRISRALLRRSST